MANHSTKDVWFWIEPYVHISVKNNTVLLYNTISGKKLEYVHRPEILKIINNLLRKNNLLVTKLKEETLKNPSVKGFIKEIREHFMGDMNRVSASTRKPIQLKHMLNIQRDVHRMKKDPYTIGKNLLSYLSEITLYINNQSGNRRDKASALSKHVYKQFLFPYLETDEPALELPLNLIENVLHQVKESAIYRLNVSGGDIFAYSQLGDLVSLLNDRSMLKIYYLHYLDAWTHLESLPLLENKHSRVHLVITFPAESEKVDSIIRYFNSREDVQFVFIIADENQVDKCEALIEGSGIKNITLQPYYNGKNLQFFQDNVFVTKEEIYSANPSQKEITARMAVNKNFFGKLTILSNGDIYANLNRSKLGNLARHSIHEVVYKELYKEKSWLRVRSGVLPCKRCLYHFLCPSISNYEYILNRNNLCHVWDQSIKC